MIDEDQKYFKYIRVNYNSANNNHQTVKKNCFSREIDILD